MVTNVSSPEEFEQELAEKMKDFMLDGKQFNVQGSWVGDDGLEVNVLVDYSIESPDGNYHVGTVYATYSDNPEFSEEEIKESETFLNAQFALTGALSECFDIPYGELYPDVISSEDVSALFSIFHGIWDIRDSIKNRSEV